jgi:hypothetical protein
MDAARPLDRSGGDTVVVGYVVIRGPPLLDMDDLGFQGHDDDGTRRLEAERLLRLAVAEAERRFELTALAARGSAETTTVLPRGHKRGALEDGGGEGAADRGAPRRRVTTTATDVTMQGAEEELEAAALPEHPTDEEDFIPLCPAAGEDYYCTVYGQRGVMPDDHDDKQLASRQEEDCFIPVDRPAAEEDDFTPLDPASDDDDVADDDEQLASQLEEDYFIPVDDPAAEDDECVVYYGQLCGGATPDDVVIDEVVELGDDGFIPLDPASYDEEDGEQLASQLEEDFIPVEPVAEEDDLIPLDPTSDDDDRRQLASEQEDEDFIPVDPAEDDDDDDYGEDQCGGVLLKELDEQFASSEVEDLLSLDQVESDEIVYDAGWLDRLIRPVLGEPACWY